MGLLGCNVLRSSWYNPRNSLCLITEIRLKQGLYQNCGYPGLSPIIPLGWGVIAFVVCLVIHEFGHGIQARAHGMRVRNLGLLMAGPLPLGAFAEPEYNEIVNSPRERQRMFAADLLQHFRSIHSDCATWTGRWSVFSSRPRSSFESDYC